MACVEHHCHGHLGQLSAPIHDCVLCQFLTLPFVAAALVAIVFFNKITKFSTAQRQVALQLDICGITTLRAPPTV